MGLIFFIPMCFFVNEAFFYILTGKRFPVIIRIIPELVTLLVYPFLFATINFLDYGQTIVIVGILVVMLCIIAYFLSNIIAIFDDKTQRIINIFLIVGIAINVAIASSMVYSAISGLIFVAIGNLPIIIAFSLALICNRKLKSETNCITTETE